MGKCKDHAHHVVTTTITQGAEEEAQNSGEGFVLLAFSEMATEPLRVLVPSLSLNLAPCSPRKVCP